jgi:hypothetical protein
MYKILKTLQNKLNKYNWMFKYTNFAKLLLIIVNKR